ncbi:N-acetylmuramoyl-L-alanine amidase [Chengkuizengella axinellae]|uniref:N-acetylmuramoyl-L-alanine amidase n=1 Tax=Chengkuizengella axinellae TaxID=3064388 RepID=A0ABT9IWL3_9BACL|nr:N-acetylmuramoyl-L-alanine amidase [Chengkuizengella sp. 2205SS18-9]MDP5273759.1 N-acetylmuramoyl-L-alanine amidase [Chengkuizengella sp. 2205SS18-9]
MVYQGIVIHHSICPSINGKGYDYYITKDLSIIPASEASLDSEFIHICIEGDFTEVKEIPLTVNEQLFLLKKLIIRLSTLHAFSIHDVYGHTHLCPGEDFPWSDLVISSDNVYH